MHGRVVILGTGATVNLVCSGWLATRNSPLAKRGFPRVETYPANARFKCGGGRMGDVRFAAEITVRIAGNKGSLTAFVLDTDIPAPLRKGPFGALGGQLDFRRDILTLGFHGVDTSLQVSDMGHYISGAMAFGGRRGESLRDLKLPATIAKWTFCRTYPDLSSGGLTFSLTEDGMCSYTPQLTSSACEAVTLGDARYGTPLGPKKILMELHANWGRASAQQIRRAQMDSQGDNLHMLHYVDQVLEHTEVCRVFGRAHHVPIAGTSTTFLDYTLASGPFVFGLYYCVACHGCFLQI